MSTGVRSARGVLDDRTALLAWFDRTRARSASLFDMIDDEAYYTRPIALRHPIVFYEGHLPAFAINVLIKKGLGRPGVDERLEQLFARGIDPHSPQAAERTAAETRALWPSREEVRDYVARAEDLLRGALRDDTLERDDVPVLRGGEGVFTIIEHEAMHQETLLYMWHRLPYALKRREHVANGYEPRVGGAVPGRATARVDAGRATLGAARGAIPFGWDNEFGELTIEVPAFDIDVHDVTNADWLQFVQDGGYCTPALWQPDDRAWVERERHAHPGFWVDRGGGAYGWRGMFQEVDLPGAWPVYVTLAEARAFAAWAGRALPSEAQYHRAAYGAPRAEGTPRTHPWGEDPPDGTRGHFDFAAWDPVPAGSHPAGASAWGVHDLVGNGWEWTSTPFAPFPGFEPMASYPEYSADFFDGDHYVIKGASPVTARELLRPTFRNWFRPRYPYVYAAFRTVSR